MTEGSLTTQVAYNGDGVRVGKTVGAATTDYLVDLAATLPVVISDTDAVYLYGLDINWQRPTGTILCARWAGELAAPLDWTDDPGPTDDQFGSTVVLIRWLDYLYGIDRVVGHRDVPEQNTPCPGKNFTQKQIDALSVVAQEQ